MSSFLCNVHLVDDICAEWRWTLVNALNVLRTLSFSTVAIKAIMRQLIHISNSENPFHIQVHYVRHIDLVWGLYPIFRAERSIWKLTVKWIKRSKLSGSCLHFSYTITVLLILPSACICIQPNYVLVHVYFYLRFTQPVQNRAALDEVEYRCFKVVLFQFDVHILERVKNSKFSRWKIIFSSKRKMNENHS